MTLTIAIPSKGVCSSRFAIALKLLQTSPFEKIQCITVEGADVAVARNLLVESMLGDYIFFLDDDVIPPMNTIPKLYGRQKDIVSGLYFAKREPYFPQIFHKTKVQGKQMKDRYDAVFDIPENELIEIDACGGGCLLIKKDVFKKLKRPFFQYIPYGEEMLKKGEDFYFSEKAKEAGFKIFCDTSIVCRHMGTASIGQEFWEISKERIKELEEKLGPEKFKEFKV